MEFLLLTGKCLKKVDGKTKEKHFETVRSMREMDEIEKELEKEYKMDSIFFHGITILNESQALIMFPDSVKEFLENHNKDKSETVFVEIKG